MVIFLDSQFLFIISDRYLGSGCTFKDLHYSHKLEISTIDLIIQEVCTVIWDELVGVYMPSFTEQYWHDIFTGFKQHVNFSNCLEAVDRKYIHMIDLTGTGVNIITTNIIFQLFY